MTVSGQASEATSYCDGVTTSFPVRFPVMDAGDLLVLLVDGDDIETKLAEGVHYTVAGTPSVGLASIETTRAYPAGVRLRRRRSTAIEQEVAYTPNDGFPARSHEGGLDRLTMVSQENAETIARATLMPRGETGMRLPSARRRAGMVQGFDGAGQPALLDIAGSAIGKLDQYPRNPRSPLRLAFARAIDDTYINWIVGNTIKPTSGGGITNGLPLVAGSVPSFWQMATLHTALFSAWRLAKDTGDVASAARHAALIEGQAAYIRSKFTASDLQTGANGVVYTVDDGVLVAMYYRELASYYGPSTTEGARWLGYLVELIPNLCQRFRDPLQTGANLIDYGVSTPGGVAFKSNRWGLLYPKIDDQFSIDFYGYVSAVIESGIAFCALYCAVQSSVPATLRAAFQTYAVNVWTWGYDYNRTPAPVDETRPAEGLYFANFNLDPNVNAANNLSVKGGAPQKSTRAPNDANQRYHQPVDAYYGRPVRAASAHYDAGTVFMGLLSARLWQLTGEQRYADEAISVGRAMVDLNGFGRDVDGLRHLSSLRDPHSVADAWPTFMRIALTIPGFDPDMTLRGALIRTARSIGMSSARGYLGPDWTGSERNPLDGTRTWGETSALQGNGGGGQGKATQIMTHGCGLSMMVTAMQVAAVETSIDNAVPLQTVLEQLTPLVGALRAALEQGVNPTNGTFNAGLTIKDTGFVLDNFGGNPFIAFVLNFLMDFDRSAGRFRWFMGRTDKAEMLLGSGGSGLFLDGGITIAANASDGPTYLQRQGNSLVLAIGGVRVARFDMSNRQLTIGGTLVQNGTP